MDESDKEMNQTIAVATKPPEEEDQNIFSNKSEEPKLAESLVCEVSSFFNYKIENYNLIDF